MRAFAAGFAALVLPLAAPAAGQTPTPTPSPSSDAPCTARQGALGALGRAMVVAFTGPVYGTHVCATVANLAIDGFTARIVGTPADTAAGDGTVVTAALTGGGAVTLPLDGATLTGAGPYVVAPGGVFPDFDGSSAEAPRVVFAYAGQRVLVIATTAVALIDLTRELRDHPGLFDADAIERAVVIASGPDAALSIRTPAGTLGAAAVTTPQVLVLIKRG